MPDPIIFIDETLFGSQPALQDDTSYLFRSSFCGPIEVGSALYLVLEDRTIPSATYAILVYKSEDSGATWSLVSGTTQQVTVTFQWTSVGYSSPRIWVLYALPTGGGGSAVLHAVAFNTNTDTWETPIDVPANAPAGNIRIWDLTVQSDGVLTIVYTGDPGGPGLTKVWYIRYNGAWGSHIQLSSNDGVAHSGIFLDPATDDTHVFYSGRDVFGAGPLRPALHRVVDSSGALGVDTQLLPAPGVATQNLYPTFGVGCVWDDQIVVPYSRDTGGGASFLPAVFIGTPVSSPVWSSTDLPFADPDTRFDPFQYAHSVAIVDADDNLNVFWGTLVWDVDFNVEYPNLMQSVTVSGTFTDAVVYYDAAVDPPTPPPDPFQQDGVFMPSIALLTTGGFGVAMEMVFDFGYSAQPDLFLGPGVTPPPTPLSITCGGSPSGSVGVPYSNFLPAAGGTPPYTYAIIAGALPFGLVLNSTSGEVFGTPTTPGTYSFTVQVTDSLAVTATVDCSILIISTLLLFCDSPPVGIVGVFYSHAFPASGGTPPYTFTLVTGFLPPGLTLDSTTGIISGIPTQGGTYAFTVNVRDAAGTSINVICSVTIGSVSVGCTNIQSGTVGVPYSQSFPATGGTPPYTFTVLAGQLPLGLSLDASTGVLSGTPLAPGTYQVTVEVTDVNGITDTAICIQIIGCP